MFVFVQLVVKIIILQQFFEVYFFKGSVEMSVICFRCCQQQVVVQGGVEQVYVLWYYVYCLLQSGFVEVGEWLIVEQNFFL